MSSNVKTFRFAIILCLVAGFCLTFAATALRPIQNENIKVDKQKNVLKALGLLESNKKYSSKDVAKLFSNNVKAQYVNQQGDLVDNAEKNAHPIFVYVNDGQLDAYVIPISGYGLWSTLYGYFAMSGDGRTVKGITFYAHGETPGLGGECEAAWFQNNFVGKKIVDERGKFVSVGIVKGKVVDVVAENKQSNYVDGISGATVTSKGIDVFLKKDLEKYESFSKRLRRGDRVL
ncbi:NADH:ubiquinone reductase (Na(+)-transporting) subunit C [Candidatus Marinamargulisbacteria bacterium SCGC AG-439-L15]|nr:NADH:ubiquinone reductase (Na(+)-transporting) subunit C [Candidatus Marinamargulisbacteria bacterium SCGC AG-439-L15]